MEYTGEAGQDRWVCEFFNFKHGGYFLNVGAMDGITADNTYVLEKEYGWNGLSLEPYGIHFNVLKKRRKNVIPKALYSKDGYSIFNGAASSLVNRGAGFGGFLVPTVTFKTLFKEFEVPRVIDYISLDIEGAEYEALTQFPFDTHLSILWTIEHNYYVHKDDTLKNQIKEIMLKNGYVLTHDNVAPVDRPELIYEDWYVHEDYHDV